MPFSTRMKILELLFLLAYLTCSLSCYAVAAGKSKTMFFYIFLFIDLDS